LTYLTIFDLIHNVKRKSDFFYENTTKYGEKSLRTTVKHIDVDSEDYKVLKETLDNKPRIKIADFINYADIDNDPLCRFFYKQYKACKKIINFVTANNEITIAHIVKRLDCSFIHINQNFLFLNKDQELLNRDPDVAPYLKALCELSEDFGRISMQRIDLIFKTMLHQADYDIDFYCETIGINKENISKWLLRAVKVCPELVGKKPFNEHIDQLTTQNSGHIYYDLIKRKLVKYINKNQSADYTQIAKEFEIDQLTLWDYLQRIAIEEKDNLLPPKITQDVKIQHRRNIIAKRKLEDPFISTLELAHEMNVTITTIQGDLEAICETWKEQRSDSFEMYLKYVLNELKVIKEESWKRFKGDTRSSSRWLEINIMALDREMKLLGLGNTQRIEMVTKNETVSKADRDAIIDAYEQSHENIVDITPRPDSNSREISI